MTKPNINPSQGIPRFSANQTASPSIVPVRPIEFSGAMQSQLQLLNTIANVGETTTNAVGQLYIASERAKAQERDAYLASIETDDVIQTNRIYNENHLQGNDPERLSTLLNEYKNAKKAEMPEGIRPYYEATFQKRAASLAVKSQDEFYHTAEINAKNSLKASLEILRDDIFENPVPKTEIEVKAYTEKLAKYNAIIQSQEDHKHITPEEAELTRRDFRKDLVTASYKASLKGLSDDARAKAIYELSNQNIEGLNINEKQEVIAQLNAYDNQLKSVKEQAFAKEKAEQELAKARQAADLELRVSRGQANYDEIVRFEQKRIISPDQKTSLFKALDAKNKEILQESQAIEKVARAMQGADYMDPKNTDDKKAVDLMYNNVIRNQIMALKDPAAQKSMLVSYIDKVGVVPESLQSRMRGVMRGTNVEDKVYMSELIGRIQEVKPQALDDFDDKDIAQAVMIDGLVKAGTPNLEAVKRVQALQDGLNPQRVTYLKEELKEKRKGKAFSEIRDEALSSVKDIFDDSFFSSVKLPDKQLGVESAAVNEYNNLFESWYVYTNGDEKLAKEQAALAMKRNWGTTSINGNKKQLTKYPVENKYPNIDSKVLRADLVASVKALPKYKNVADEDIYLTYDAITAREWRTTDSPSYAVVVKNENGVFEPIADEKGSRWSAGKPSDIRRKLVEEQRQAFVKEKGVAPSQKIKGPEMTIPVEKTIDLLTKPKQ